MGVGLWWPVFVYACLLHRRLFHQRIIVCFVCLAVTQEDKVLLWIANLILFLAATLALVSPSLRCIVFALLLTTGRMLIVFRQDYAPIQNIVRYVILQEVGTCLFIIGWVVQLLDVQVVGLLIKLGLPPFHTWLLECGFGISIGGLWCLIISSKLLPISLLLRLAGWFWGVVFVVVGRLSVFISHTVVNLLMVSRWIIIGWIVITFSCRVIFNLLFYLISIGGVVNIVYHVNELTSDGMNWIGLLILVGLPMGRMFLIKFYLLREVRGVFNGLLVIILLVFRVLSTVGYYHVFSVHVQMTKISSVSLSLQNSILPLIVWFVALILICLVF